MPSRSNGRNSDRGKGGWHFVTPDAVGIKGWRLRHQSDENSMNTTRPEPFRPSIARSMRSRDRLKRGKSREASRESTKSHVEDSTLQVKSTSRSASANRSVLSGGFATRPVRNPPNPLEDSKSTTRRVSSRNQVRNNAQTSLSVNLKKGLARWVTSLQESLAEDARQPRRTRAVTDVLPDRPRRAAKCLPRKSLSQ